MMMLKKNKKTSAQSVTENRERLKGFSFLFSAVFGADKAERVFTIPIECTAAIHLGLSPGVAILFGL